MNSETNKKARDWINGRKTSRSNQERQTKNIVKDLNLLHRSEMYVVSTVALLGIHFKWIKYINFLPRSFPSQKVNFSKGVPHRTKRILYVWKRTVNQIDPLDSCIFNKRVLFFFQASSSVRNGWMDSVQPRHLPTHRKIIVCFICRKKDEFY